MNYKIIFAAAFLLSAITIAAAVPTTIHGSTRRPANRQA